MLCSHFCRSSNKYIEIFRLDKYVFLQAPLICIFECVCLRPTITGTHGTELLSPFFNFFCTCLFSIKFLYFFIISSLFPYFNLFLSIFIPSYANSNLHVSILYILIIHGGIMVSVLASSAVDRGFEHRWGQTKTLKFVFDASPLSTQH